MSFGSVVADSVGAYTLIRVTGPVVELRQSVRRHSEPLLPGSTVLSKLFLTANISFILLNVLLQESNMFLPEFKNCDLFSLFRVYNIGIQVTPGRGRYRDTNIVTFAPRFEIDNQSRWQLAIAQKHATLKEARHMLWSYV